MIFFLFIVLIIWALLYLFSKNKYGEYIAPLDKKTCPFMDLLPLGFLVMDLLGYRYSTSYDHKLLMKVSEMSGHKFGLYYLKVHWANKIVYMLLGLLVAGLFGMALRPGPNYFLFIAGFLGLIFYFADSELDEKIKKRHLKIQYDFPEFLNKLTLLINAGMTVRAAWEKIIEDKHSDSPLYLELEQIVIDIRSGKPEVNAYEDFAKRCRMQEVSKFVSAIVQNLRKGNSELVSILRLQANECWEMRKHAARRFGEEAGTRMLFPMMIMFIAILMIVSLPAILALRGI